MTDFSTSPRVRLLSITLVTLVVLSPLVAPLGVGPIGTAAANTGVHYVTDSGFEIEDTSGGAAPRSGNPYPDADTLELPGITLSASGDAYVTLEQRTGTFTNLTNVDDGPSILVTPDDKQEVALMGGFDQLNFSDATYAAADSDADLVYSASSTATLRLESTGLSTGTTVNAIDVDSDSTLDSASISSNGSVTFSSLDAGEHSVNLQTPAAAPSISSFSVTNPSGQDVTVSFDSDTQLSTISATISGAESATLTESDFSESGSGPYTYEATYSGSSDGTYTATLDTATDGAGNDGASGESDSVTVDTYTPPPSPDPAYFDVSVSVPDTVTAGDEIPVDATIENLGDQSGTQTISVSVDGSQHDTRSVSLGGGASGSLTVAYPTNATDVGDLDISVTSDNDGEIATVTVTDAAPTADAGPARTVATNTTVRFDGTSSTDNLGITSYEWDFGDGTTATGTTPTHSFLEPGNYTVELTVTDQGNNTDTDTATVTVTDAADTADPSLTLQSASGPVALPVNGSRTTTVTVSNNATTAWNLTDYTITGPDADVFSVVSPELPATVAGGQTRSLTVRAADDTLGNRTATLTVSTDHPAQSTLTTSLAATVREPAPTLDASAENETETPSLPVNSSTTITRTVTNDGEIDWTVTDVTVTGADAGIFEVRSPPTPATITGGETLPVDIRVTPTTPGTLTGTLELSTDNPAQPTVTQTITVEGRESSVSFSVPSVNFDTNQTGPTGGSQTDVSLRNTVNRTVTIQTVTVTGSGADRFSVNATGGFDLGPGEVRTLSVAFDPEINETSTATLRVTPAGDGQPITLSLSGSGGAPSPSLGVDSLTFENVSLGEAGPVQRISVTNDGTAPLVLDQSTITGPDARAFSLTNETLEVPSGETRSVGIRYQPSGTQPQQATLVLAGPHARTTLPLSGTPSFSRAETNTSSLYFGEQAVNETTTRQFTITNPGGSNQPLAIESLSVTGQNADEFATSIGTQTLRPGEQTTVDVTLSPDSPGSKSAILKVVTNSSVDPQIDVWLSNSQTVIIVERVSDGNATRTDTDTPDGNATDGESESTVQVTGENIPDETRISVNVSQPETRRSEAALDVVATTLKRGGNFSMNISHRQQPTAGVPDFEATSDNESLRYVDITHSFSNAEVSNSSFLVRVSKTRIQQQGIDPGTVVMNRYHDGEWQRLSASRVRETQTHHIYRVRTPGFSTFAVTAPVPELTLETVSLNQTEIRLGEAVTVTATVLNNGTAKGTMTVPLIRNGTTVATKNVTVGAGSVETVSFVTRPDTIGNQTFTVSSTMAGPLNVQADTGPGDDTNETTPVTTITATPATTDSPGETETGDGGSGSPIPVVVVLLVLIGGGVTAWWFRQRRN